MTAPRPLPVAGKIGDDSQQRGNRTHVHYQDYFTGDGTLTRFPLTHTPRDTSQMAVYVAGLRLSPKQRATAYDFTLDGSVLVLTAAPAAAAHILVDTVI